MIKIHRAGGRKTSGRDDLYDGNFSKIQIAKYLPVLTMQDLALGPRLSS